MTSYDGVVPWECPRNRVDGDDLSTELSSCIRNSPYKERLRVFGGNFSCIVPLEDDATLGIAHFSHRTQSYEFHTHHNGIITRVVIPVGCMIIFHANLYHYGDKAEVGLSSVKSSLRAFFYLTHEHINIYLTYETWKASYIQEGWCDDECNECSSFMDILKKERMVKYIFGQFILSRKNPSRTWNLVRL